MTFVPEMIIPADLLQQQIAYAEKQKEQWVRSLADVQTLNNGRMRINGVWETNQQAAARMQELIDIHARTIELISSFRIDEAADESP